MSDVLLRRIEEASLNAWQAHQQIYFDGWVLRFANGYTKRANSVNGLHASTLDAAEKIRACEKIYAAKNLPAIFRITPFASPANLDALLATRGYAKIDLTRVMHCELRGGADTRGELRDESLDEWFAHYCSLADTAYEKRQAHKEILQNIPTRRLFAARYDAEQLVACGLGVLEEKFFGLFDIVVAAKQRNRGHGTRLTRGMLEWARANGAAHAYLQVVAANAPARQVYGKLGFADVYEYWYRVVG